MVTGTVLVTLAAGFDELAVAVDFSESPEQLATNATIGAISTTATRVAACRRERPRHSARADIQSS
ncbi:hypothetical protein NS14008_16715 [Nocardia seriolae]|nr:hypothetical protein NS14008_16715 [Nocardia seriolae]